MAGGGDVSVRVPINLEIMNNSLTDIKKTLDSLSPNTKNFESLKGIVSDMEKTAKSFSEKMAVPFKSKAQFTSAGKDLDKFLVQMEKFNKLRDGLTLDNFKVIDPAALQQIQQLKQELEKAQQEIAKIQQQTLQGLFNDVTIKESLIKIDPSITEKSFEEVEQIVSEKIDEINNKISEIGTKNTKAIQIGDKLKQIVGKDFISADVLGEDVFSQFFKKNGAFKSGQQGPFLDYLKDMFNLSPQQIQDLTDKTASQINEILNRVNQSGNREFFKTQRGAATRAENQNKNEVQEYQAQRDLLSDVQMGMDLVSASVEKYREKIQETNKEIQKTGESSKKVASDSLANDYNQMASAVENYKASLESAQGSLIKLERQQATFNSLKSAITNFMGFAQVAGLVKKAWSDATAHIKELDQVMTGIAIVTDMSTADLWNQVDAYTQLAQKYGTTIKGAYEVSQIYYQQGLKSNEVMQLTEETLKLSKISGLDYATTTDYMTTALRGFHMEMNEASRVVDVYSALAASTAVSQQELAEAMTRTASSMEAVGTSFEEASAMISTIVAATRESASNIGSAMKSIASRYGELTKDPTKLIDSEGEEMSFNKVDTALKSIGISMHTADGQFRSFTEVILELSNAWDTLDSKQQRYIATQMAGNRQQSRFLALVSNGDELRRNLETAQNSEGTGSLQAGKYLEGLEAKLNRVQTAWQEFYTTIGIEGVWKNFLDGAVTVLNTLNGLPKAFNKIPIAAIGAITTIINAAKTLGTTALGGLAKVIMPYVLAAGQAAEAAAGQEGLKGGRKYTEEFQKALKGLSGGVASKIAGAFTVAAGALNTLALTMDTADPKARKLAGGLANVSVALQGISAVISFIKKDYASGIMSLVGAITSGIAAYGLFNETTEEKLNRLKEDSDNLKQTAEQLKSEERSLTTLKKKYDQLAEHRYDSEEAAQAFQEIQNEIAEKFPELVSAYDSVGNATIETADLEQQLANARQESAAASIAAAEAEIRYQKIKTESDRIKFKERNAELLRDNNRSLQTQYKEQVQTDDVLSRVISESRGIRAMETEFLTDSRSNTSISDDAWLTQVLGNYLVGIIDQNQSTHFNISRDSVFEFFHTTGPNHIAGRGMAESKADNLQRLTYLYENVLPEDYRSSIINKILQDKKALQEYNRLTNELLSRTDYDTEDYKQLFTDWQDTYMEVLEILPEAQRDLGEEIATSINLAQQGIMSSKKLINSLEKTGVQQAMNILVEKNKLIDLQGSSMYTIFSNKLLSGASTRGTDANGEQISFEAYVSQYEEDLVNLNSWLNSLDYYVRQEFEARLKDREHYNTYEDLTSGLDLGDIPLGLNLEELINDYYNPEEIKALATAHIDAAKKSLERQKKSGTAKTVGTLNGDFINSTIEQNFNNQLIKYGETVAKYNSNWNYDLAGMQFAFTQLDHALQDTIMKNGILSPEGIDASVQALKDAGRDENDILVQGLLELRANLANNILLSLQTDLNTLGKGADTALSSAKKLQTGVKFEELGQTITTLNSYLTGDNQLTDADFDFIDGSWTIKLGSFNKVIQGYTAKMGKVEAGFAERIKAYDAAAELLEKIGGNEDITDVKILTEAGLDVTKYLQQGENGWEWLSNDEDFKKKAFKVIKDNKSLAQTYSNLYTAEMENYQLGMQDLIRDAKRVDKTFTTVINNRTDLKLADINQLGQQLGLSGYQEMIDKGFVSFVGNRWIASASQLQKMLDEAKNKGSLSLDQINSYQAQVTKIAEESSVEAALSNIISSPDKVTEDMLVAWANALHTNVDNIRHLFIKNVDGKTYTVNDIESLIQLEGMDGTEAANKYYQSLRNNTKQIYSAFVNAISTGQTQYLDKTSVNTAKIEELKEVLAENGIQITEQYGQYVINAINTNTQGIITLIENSDLEQEEQNKQIDTLLKAEQSKNFDNIFSSILKNTKNISRDTMQKLADFYGVSIQALLNTDAFNFNELTDSYEVSDTRYLKSILVSAAGKITNSAYRMLEAQLYSLENEFTGSAMSFLSNTSIKETDVANIFNKYVETLPPSVARAVVDAMPLSDFIEKYFIRDLNGGLQIKDNAALKEIGAYFGLTEDQIASALATRISKVISSFGTLANEANGGFDSLDKANAILQDVRASGFHADFNYMFEYSESLHKFIYTNEGIMLRVQQLREQLESGATELEKQRAGQQLDQFMTQMGQNIDIVGYRQLSNGTIEQTRAQNELIRHISNYNAAAQLAGKAVISADLVNSAIAGNMNSIIELYTLLGKELTSDQLMTIYQQPVTDIQNAISTLENLSVGDLIDSTTADILSLSGAINVTASEIAGKYRVEDINFDSLAIAYSTLYDVLNDSTKATTKQLNDVLFKMINAQVGKEQAGIEALGGAMSMTIEQFGNLLVQSGETLTKDFLTENNEWSKYVTLLGGNKLQITDFEGLAKRVGWDTTSELYKTTYKSYVDSMIQQNNSMRESILSFGSNIEKAQIGDQINVSQFGLADGEYLFGTIEQGILTLNEYMGYAIETIIDQYGEYLNTYDLNTLNRISNGKNKKVQQAEAAKNLIDSWDNASYATIEAFAKSIGADTEDIIAQLFVEQQDGSFKGDYSIKDDFIHQFSTNEVMANYVNNIKQQVESIYSSIVNAFTSDQVQYVEDSAELRQIIDEYGLENVATFSEKYGRWLIDTSKLTTEEILTILENSGQDNLTIAKNFDAVLQSAREKSFNNVFSSILENTTTISRTVMENLATAMGTSLESLLDTGAFSFNESTQGYSVDRQWLLSILQTQKDKIDDITYAMLEAQLYTMQSSFSTDALTMMGNSNIKPTDVALLIQKYYEATGINLLGEDGILGFINEYFFNDANNNLQFKDNAALRQFATQFGITEQQLASLMTTRLSKTISGMNSLATDIANGFTSFEKADAIVQELQAAGQDVNFDDIFDYNYDLNKFFYTTKGIIYRVTQLDKQLKTGLIDEERGKEQLDQFISQLAQPIDITKVLQAHDGTKEKELAEEELVRNVVGYNAAIIAAYGIDSNEYEQKFIDKDVLTDAINGDLTSIQTIYDAIGKTLSTDQLMSIYQQPLTSVQNMSKALDGLQVGSIIDENTKKLLELSNLSDKMTISKTDIQGKYKIENINFDQITEAYASLYEILQNSAVATTEELNSLALKIAKSQVSKQKAGLDLLSNAASMTFDQFAEGLEQAGVEITENFIYEYQQAGLIDLLGGDKLQIKDFDSFASLLGLEKESMEYQRAYSSWADSMVQQNNTTRDKVLSIISAIESGNIGDQINVAGFEVGFAGIENGILTIGDNVDEYITQLLAKYGEYLNSYEKNRLTRYGTNKEIAQATAAKTLIESWDHASYDAVEAFAKATGSDIQELIGENGLFKENADHTFSGTVDKFAFARTYLDTESVQDLIRNSNNATQDIINQVINSNITALSAGQQKINVTNDNREVLEELASRGIGRIENATNEFIMDALNDNVDTLIAVIQSSNANDSQKRQWISQIYQQRQNDTNTSLLQNMVNNASNLSFDIVSKIADNTELKTVYAGIIKFNEKTEKWFVDIKALAEVLETTTAEALGIDEATFNTLKAQVLTQRDNQTPQALGRQIISSRENISREMYANILNMTSLTEEQLKQYMTEKDGHYEATVDQAIALAKNIGMSQDEIFKTFASGIISNINTLSGGIINGFTDMNAMQEILKTVNRNTKEEVNFNDLFKYDKFSNSFGLTENGIVAYIAILRKQIESITDEAQKALIESQITILEQNVKNSINFDNVFSSGKGTAAAEKNHNQLIKQLKQFKAVTGNTEIDKWIDDLFKGGELAVNAASEVYKILGKEFTDEEAEKFRQSNLNKIKNGREALDKGINSYITKDAAAFGVAAGYFEVGNEVDGLVQILKVNKDKLEDALKLYYAALLGTGEATTEELNNAILDIWDEQGRKAAGGMDLLTKGDMTYREFGEGLIAAGINLTSDMLDQFVEEGLINKIAGTNKIRIADFDAFASRIGITDKNSQVYKDAYSTFVDNTIKDATRTRTDIISAMSNIQSAKAGDQLNIANAMSAFDEKTQYALALRMKDLGAEYSEGILKISKDSNLLQIAQLIGEAAQQQGVELEQTMLELADSIQKAVQGYIDAIVSGLKGGITNVGKSELLTLTKQFGLDGLLKETDFIQTANGMKIATSAAIDLYNELNKLADVNVDTSKLFEGISESIMSRDEISTMDGIMAKIANLQRQISENQNKQTGNVEQTNAVLQKELALYQQIARSSMSDPNKYKFMEQALPDKYQGAVNYWQNTSTMLTSMVQGAKTGYMSIQDFYNIVTTMQNMADQSGKDMSFMGYTLKAGMDTASTLIEAGFSNFGTTAEHAGDINLKGLSGLGVNLQTSAKDMAAGVEDGIHSIAQSQVDMLDAAIKVLETIVAMEGISDAIDGDGLNLTLDDIFEIDANGQQRLKGDIQKATKYCLEAAEGNETIEKYLNNIKLGQFSMGQILSDIADNGKIDTEGLTDEIVLNAMKIIKFLSSQDAFGSIDDPQDVFDTLRTLNIPGLRIDIQEGDTECTLVHGRYIYKDKNGKWEGISEDQEEAYKQLKTQELTTEIDNLNKNRTGKDRLITIDEKNNDFPYTINFKNGTAVQLKYDSEDGGIITSNGNKYTDFSEALNKEMYAQAEALIKDNAKHESGILYKDMQTWQLRLAFGIDIAPTINNPKDLTPEMMARLLAQDIDNVDEIIEAGEYKLGFKINPEMTEAEKNDWNEALKHLNEVDLKVKPINASEIEVNGALHVKAVVDEIINDDNKITYTASDGTNKTVSLNGATSLADLFTDPEDQSNWENIYKSSPKLQRYFAPNGTSLKEISGVVSTLDRIQTLFSSDEKLGEADVNWLTNALGGLKALGYNTDVFDFKPNGEHTKIPENTNAFEQFVFSNAEFAKAWSPNGKALNTVEGLAGAFDTYQRYAVLDKNDLTPEAQHWMTWFGETITKANENLGSFEERVNNAEAEYQEQKKNSEFDYSQPGEYRKSEYYQSAAKYADVFFKYSAGEADAYYQQVAESILAVHPDLFKTSPEEFQNLVDATFAHDVHTWLDNGGWNAIYGTGTTPEKTATEKANAATEQFAGTVNSATSALLGFINALNGGAFVGVNTDEIFKSLITNGKLTKEFVQEQMGNGSLTQDLGNYLLSLFSTESESTSSMSNEQPKEQSNPPAEPSTSIDEQSEAQRRQDALGGAEAEQLRYMAEAEEQIIQTGQKYEEAVSAVTEGPLAQSSEVQAAWQEYQDALSMWKVYSGQDYADEHAVLSSPEAIDAIENSVQNIDTTTEQNNKNQEDIDAALSLVQDIGNKLSTLMQEREQEIEESGSTEWEGDLPALDTEIAATLSDLGWAYSELESLTGDAASTIGAAGETISGTTAPINDVTRALEALSSATSSANSAIDTTNSKLGAMKSADVHFGAYFNGSPVSGSHTAIINIQTKVNGGGGEATGNVALASGTRTLMGELGPELVVSNGQYFLAGQNGAEFVDLAKDAIVFNHIQTRRLLANGSSGRGTPLTNERNATSMATGNVHGPAKSSASAALATLRKLRAEWDAIAHLPIADLAKKGGGGGGGGNKQIPGFIRDVERWYNWLQKIADLEKEITYQEQLRSKIQSDMNSNGKAYYASQKKSYEEMRMSAVTSESLYLSQKDYFEKRREQLNSKNSPLSTLYTFDESGQLHFQDGAYQWLADLFKADDYGHQTLSPKQQYEMILAKNPQFAQFMKYDESGKEITKKDYKTDDEYYLAMVKAFSDRMDSEKEEMQELFDSLHEQEQAVLEQMQAMNEQLQAMKDNQKEVEESVLKAIEESRQRQIDEMKDTKEAIQKTNEDFIDGLNKSLEKERQMYEDTQKDQELERNRRQLAILKRSGASASQIAQLQEKVDQQARDQYFEKQQEQIDAVKEASDLQLEKMDLQIELAQEQLDYEKAHGLLWGQVYEVMAKTPQEIAQYIKDNTADFWSYSPLNSAEKANEILFKAEQWTEFRDDIDMQKASLGMINQNLDIFLAAMKEIHGKDANWDKIEGTAKTKYEALFGGNFDDPGKTAWEAYQSATEYAAKPPKTETTTTTTTTGTGSGSGSGRNGKEKTWSYNATHHYHKNWHNGKWSMADPAPHTWKTTKKMTATGKMPGKNFGKFYDVTKTCTVCGYTTTEKTFEENPQGGGTGPSSTSGSAMGRAHGQNELLMAYASGGKNNYTGLALMHGTPTDPEAVLNADDYRAWKEDIKTTNLLYNALADVSALQHSAAAAASSTTNNNSGIVIEHAEVSMNATIANDYDARRAGEQALEQMLTIARKSGTRSAQRR